MVLELEVLQFEKVLDVLQIAGNEVVHGDDSTAIPDEVIAQVRAKKPRSASN